MRFADEVYAVVRRAVRDDRAALRITEAVFAGLPATLERYDPDAGAFDAWLRSVAEEAVLAEVGSSRTASFGVAVEPVLEPPSFAPELDAIGSAFCDLEEDQRAVLLLRHVGGLSPRQIADRLGRTEEEVHGLHHMARQSLEALAAPGRTHLTPAQPIANAVDRL